MKRSNGNGWKYTSDQLADFLDRYKAGEPIWSISPKIGVKPSTLHLWKRTYLSNRNKAKTEFLQTCFKSDFIRYNGDHSKITEVLGISRSTAIKWHKQFFPEILDKTAMTAKLYHLHIFTVNEISFFLNQTIQSTKAIIRKIERVNKICSLQNQNQNEGSR